MQSFWRPILLTLIALLAVTETGCRAIRRFGDSRTSIAARRLSGQGFQAMHDGQWQIAETLFSDALEISKTDDRAHWGLAEALWKRGEIDPAIGHMQRAVHLSAGDPKFVQRLGRMYLELGHLEEADRHSRWALESKRDSAEAWALRGDCLKAAGQHEDALAAYHRALALQPDYPHVQLQAAEIYGQQRRFDRLLATLDRLQDGTGIEDAEPRVDILQGTAMRQLGRLEEARRCFLRAAAKDPTDATPHLELASLLLQQGQTDAARQSLAIARGLDPDSVRAAQVLAQLDGQPQPLGRDRRVAREAPLADPATENRY
jgi:tetratricopeptide (TPR) repeat protein